MNKICVYLIDPYGILRKGNKKDLHFKVVTMIDPIMVQFEIMEYEDKCAIQNSNLFETT